MKKTTPALAASVLVLGALAVAAPAQAGATCTGTSQTKIIASGATPATVVIGTTVPRTLTLYDQVEDPCTAAVSSEVLMDNSPLSDDMEQVDRVGNVASFKATYRIDPRDLGNDDAGAWQADLTAHGISETHGTVPFRLLRATRLTVNASPERARKGRPVTVQGLLTRASWDTHSYRPMRRTTVTLETRRPGEGTYVPLKTVRTDANGRLKVSLTGERDLCVRLVFAGSSTTAAVASGGDCVVVR
jgi:hypothetical protein